MMNWKGYWRNRTCPGFRYHPFGDEY